MKKTEMIKEIVNYKIEHDIFMEVDFIDFLLTSVKKKSIKKEYKKIMWENNKIINNSKN